MSSEANIKTGRGIHDSLEELIKAIVGNTEHNYQLLELSTNYLAQCPNSINSSLQLEESVVLGKLLKEFRQKENIRSDGTKCGDLLLELYEELNNSSIKPELRSSLLAFCYHMMNTRTDYQTLEEQFDYKNYVNKKSNNNQSTPTQYTNLQNKFPFQNRTGADVNKLNNCNGLESLTKLSTRYSHTNRPTKSIFSYDPYKSIGGKMNFSPLERIPNLLDMLNEDKSYILNSDLVQNLIYTFAGLEGNYFKKDVITGRYKLDAYAKSLTETQSGMILRLAELGYYHDNIVQYADVSSGLTPLGQMGQGLVSALRIELTKYYGLIAMLQDQFNYQNAERNAVKGSDKCRVTQKVTLIKLVIWSTWPLQRLQWLTRIGDACKMKKGGELVSILYSLLGHGCPKIKATTRHLLIAACGPLLRMISRWLLEGDIVDVNSEFFIECLAEVGADRLWHDKYRIRHKMLPSFIPLDFANKILVTGKSINFLCEICQDKEPIKGRDEFKSIIEAHPEHIFSEVQDTKLHLAIESIYQYTAKRVLDTMVGPHKLLDHLQAMRRYLLLGQGDFICVLMENMEAELDKPANLIYAHDLSSIMDTSLRCSTAQYDDQEILNHLDVRMMAPYGGEIGWDIISLQYTVRGPLATMLEPSMSVYQMLFKPLWRMKHMEFLLSSKIWKEQKCNAKLLHSMSAELSKVLYRLYQFTSEMMHFVHQMEYYILFEVIECNWVEFQKRITQSKALDGILAAHKQFLERIKRGAFLDANSTTISCYLESVYDNIIRLDVWQRKFYELSFKELNAREAFRKRIKDSEALGKFGVTAEDQLQRDQDLKIFQQNLHSQDIAVNIICSDYEKAVRGFLLSLNSNNDPNLQLFGIRLDFNEYYKKRDMRLSVPLTFEHMRMSSIFVNPSKSASRYSMLN